MRKISLLIETEIDKETIKHIVNSFDGKDGIEFKVENISEERQFDGGSISHYIDFTVGFVSGVAGGIVANIIYDAMKRLFVKKLSIEDELVSDLTIEKLERIIKKTFEERELDNDT